MLPTVALFIRAGPFVRVDLLCQLADRVNAFVRVLRKGQNIKPLAVDPNPFGQPHSVSFWRHVVGGARTGWDDPATTLPCLDTYGVMIPELR